MTSGYIVVTTTLPDPAQAQSIGRLLVEERLAACAQALPCSSIYRWNGAVQQESEFQLVLKTRSERWPVLEARLRALHPYEVPEIIAVPVLAGSAAYLSWIDSESSDVADET